MSAQARTMRCESCRALVSVLWPSAMAGSPCCGAELTLCDVGPPVASSNAGEPARGARASALPDGLVGRPGPSGDLPAPRGCGHAEAVAGYGVCVPCARQRARTRLLCERERLETGLAYARGLVARPPFYWDKRAREMHAADLAWREARLAEIGRQLTEQ